MATPSELMQVALATVEAMEMKEALSSDGGFNSIWVRDEEIASRGGCARCRDVPCCCLPFVNHQDCCFCNHLSSLINNPYSFNQRKATLRLLARPRTASAFSTSSPPSASSELDPILSSRRCRHHTPAGLAHPLSPPSHPTPTHTMASPPASHPFMRQHIGPTPSPPNSTHTGPTFASLAPTPASTGKRTSATPTERSDVRSERSTISPLPPPRPGATRSPRLGANDPPPELEVPTAGGIENGDAAPAANGSAMSQGAREWVARAAAAEPETPRKLSRWEEKVQGDLAGWRGGHG